MPKAFLSHSNKQKFFVQKVAEIIDSDKIIYDDFTFEEGNRNIDEIFCGLEQSDVFVLFISGEALDSDWVKKEIFTAEKFINEKKIRGFYPIIIDKTKHSDPRIPDWIKEYNLRNVSKPTKVAERIKQKLRIVTWELYPKNKLRQQLFIGRNNYKRLFDERIFNYDLPTPITIIVSGLPQVGRRHFLMHSLINSNKIRDYYRPPTINLNSRASIEDFILYIYDLGYVDSITRDQLVGFLNISIEEKIELARILLLEIFETDNIIFLIDNYSIVSQDGHIVDWYITLNELLSKDINKISLVLISRVVPRFELIKNKDYIYSISLPGLDKNECKNLFQAHLELEKFELPLEDKKIISELFTGFPTQIIFTVDYLKNVGISQLRDNLNIIADYNSEHISATIRKYEDDKEAMNLLKILAEYDIISLKLLGDIYGGIKDEVKDLIIEFTNQSLIEYVGAIKEYMKLNDGVRDYVQRLNIDFDKEYLESIKKNSLKILKDYSKHFDADMSEIAVSLQTALVNGDENEIPKELLIPSYYLNAMNDLYRKRSYDSVVELGDKLLQNKSNLDQRIIREIRYWLCSALAKKRDRRFTQEVQYISGPDHNFLFGFYYRLTRRYEEAQSRLLELLELHPNYYRAKRELVLVYISLEDYDSAFELAKESYQIRKNNPYYIHAYFRCLIKKSNSSIEKRSELLNLLEQLKTIPSEKADEMFYSLKAEYEAFVERKPEKAYLTINKGISKYPDNIYPYFTKMEISRKFYDIENLTSIIESLKINFNLSELENRLNYLIAQVICYALNKNITEAQNYLNNKIKDKYPLKIITEIEQELDGLS